MESVEQVPGRRCPRCGKTKPASGFYVSKQTGHGLTTYCRGCIVAESNARRASMTPEERHAKDSADAMVRTARRRSDPAVAVAERAKEQRFRDRNGRAPSRRDDPASHAEYMREWRAGNRERAREISREAHRAYRRKDPERHRIQSALKSNNYRAKKLGIGGRLTYVDWLDALARYDNRCAYCGARECLFDIDHVDAFALGGLNVPTNIAPACRPCNAQKHAKTLDQFCALRGLDPAVIRARATNLLAA